MASVELQVPQLGESIREATIASWLKKPGEPVSRDEPVVELDTDKVSVAVSAPAAGVLAEQRFATGSTVKVGQAIGTIEVGAAAGVAPSKPAPAAVPVPAVQSAPPQVPAALKPPEPKPAPPPGDGQGAPPMPPSVRKFLREHDIDPATVRPAAGGRVTLADVTPLANRPETPKPAAAPVSSEEEEVVPMTPLRRRIAERLVQAQHTAAVLTTFNEIDMSHVMALRAKHQEAFTKRHGVKLGFMSFFVKAAIDALREYPGLNAEIRGDAIVYKKHYHVGVAIGGGAGLVVPVIKNAERLGFAQIEKQIGVYAEKAKEKKLTLQDLSGGTFSITNGGVYGSLLSTPLLNPPQTGILGMHKIQERPIAVEGKVEIRPMMNVALSYDHRVVDGREAVSFLVGVKNRIEAPERLMLDV